MKKRSDLITVILFCLIIAVLSTSFLIMPDKAFSQQENRALQQAPTLDGDRFFSGEFAKDTNVYFSDQFPLRNWFVRLKSASELAMLKGENNGVLYSYNQLAVKNFSSYRSAIEITENTDRIFEESITTQLNRVDRLGNKLNVPLVTVIPPRTIDIADSVFGYNRPDGDKAFLLMSGLLGEKSGYVETLSPLREKYENGEYVYYRTDHHWTTLGAYYTYCDIMRQYGKEDKIIPIESFSIETVTDFSGTTAARANFPFYKRDVIEIWHLPDDNEYQITADGEALDGFYNMTHAKTSDKYSLFLDGTHNVTTITKSGGDRKTLLVAKDSFANCLIPFLAREFNIVALDLKSNPDISSAVIQYSADAVLIVYNTENVISTGNLGKVR